MPSFTTPRVQDIADFLIPVTPEQAAEIAAFAREAEDRRCYAAVYGPDMYGKRIAIALYVTHEVTDSGAWYHVVTDDYHPRKVGRAQLVYR